MSQDFNNMEHTTVSNEEWDPNKAFDAFNDRGAAIRKRENKQMAAAGIAAVGVSLAGVVGFAATEAPKQPNTLATTVNVEDQSVPATISVHTQSKGEVIPVDDTFHIPNSDPAAVPQPVEGRTVTLSTEK